MPSVVPNQACISSRFAGASWLNLSLKAFCINWRANAAEQGQVDEYGTSTLSSMVNLPLFS